MDSSSSSSSSSATLVNTLWIVAKIGFTKEVAPFMNLSKATRECKNLQREMREVMHFPEFCSPFSNQEGKTQLHYFCEKGMTASVVRMLEMRSIDVESRNDGKTCLMTAAFFGHVDICRLLLAKGARLEAKDDGYNDGNDPLGDTPLFFAAMIPGHIEAIRFLIDRGANIEARNFYGWRPIHRAAHNGNYDVVKELVERKAKINARTHDRLTALEFARSMRHPDIAAYLVSHGGKE